MLPLTSYVTLGKSLDLPELQGCHLKIKMTPISWTGQQKTLSSITSFFLSPSFPSPSSFSCTSLTLSPLNSMTNDTPVLGTFHSYFGPSRGSLYTLLCSRVTLGHTGTSKTLGPPPLKAPPEQVLRCQSQPSAPQSPALAYLNHVA